MLNINIPYNYMNRRVVRELCQIIRTVWEKIAIKRFSSPNVSNRSIVTPKKVVKHRSMGKSLGGPSKLGGQENLDAP